MHILADFLSDPSTQHGTLAMLGVLGVYTLIKYLGNLGQSRNAVVVAQSASALELARANTSAMGAMQRIIGGLQQQNTQQEGHIQKLENSLKNEQARSRAFQRLLIDVYRGQGKSEKEIRQILDKARTEAVDASTAETAPPPSAGSRETDQ